MQFHLQLFACLLAVVCLSTAQNSGQEKTWGVFIYTLHGDSTPAPFWRPKSLTPLGAHQLYNAGNAIRRRFVSPQSGNETGASGRISGISEYRLRNDQIEVFSTADEVMHASALAFMQGLYPPSADMYDGIVLVDDSAMVNGTAIESPLSGYQYPNIISRGPDDPAFIELAGHMYCPNYTKSEWSYILSQEVEEIRAETDAFYEYLYRRVLHHAFSKETVNYINAHLIFDYLNYEYIHNETARDNIYPDVLHRARYLASRRLYDANANTTAVGARDDAETINSVAGMTLAYSILNAFEANILSQGEKKLSLLFGSAEPIMSLFSLLRLPSGLQRNFYGRPNPGASMVIELFSQEADPSAEFPQSDTEFMVRLFLRNETDPWDFSTPLVPYSMFGLGPSQVVVPYKEFVSKLIGIGMPVSTWCRACGSSNGFCYKYTVKSTPDTDSDVDLSAVYIIVGVIGVPVLLFLLGFCMCFCVVIYYHLKRRTKTRSNHRPKSSRIKRFNPSMWTPAWLGKKNSQGTASWEMNTIAGTHTNASDSCFNGRSPPLWPASSTVVNEEDDDEVLISPAAQPAKIRELV